jgi:DNA-binding response OmpR family regulator
VPEPLVLVIDDEAGIRQAFAEVLRLAGYGVSVAGNGREGLGLARRSPVALAIVDLFMPEVDGFQVIRALRSDHPTLPILAISGGGGVLTGPRDVLDVALFAGATRILQKPIDLRALVDVVRALVPAPPPAGGSPAVRPG